MAWTGGDEVDGLRDGTEGTEWLGWLVGGDDVLTVGRVVGLLEVY